MISENGVGHPAKHALHQGQAREQALHHRGNCEIDLGHHVNRGALVDGQIGGLFGQLRDKLHRGRPGPDDRDTTPRKAVAIVPRGGVDNLAIEAGDTGDIGSVRLGQEARLCACPHALPGRCDQDRPLL